MKKLKFKKKICLVTSSRADYSLMSNLIDNLKSNNFIDFTLLITGQHLSKKYGNTYKTIINKHKKVSKLIKIKVRNTDEKSILFSMSETIKKVGKYFSNSKKDIIIILGDRYETLCIALSAYLNNCKIAHIHGGEKTVGSMDDSFRHSITKFSNLHFVSTNEYKKRVMQLGENKNCIHVVGALGSEMVSNIILLKKKKLEKELNMKFNKFNFLITINSYSYEKISIRKVMKNIFKAVMKYKNTNYIFTLPNSDLNSDLISGQIYKFCKRNKNCYIFKNLGFNYYSSVMKYCDVVIGNSSSGIIEAPSLKVPTVNIGERQKGRIKPDTIVDAKPNSSDIFKAIKKTLSRNFRIKIAKSKNLYYKKNSSKKIFKIIKNINLKKIDKKEFQDIRFL